MIVIGVDVHKHALSAVAVDELGRTVAAHAGPVDEHIIEWARSLDQQRLWALEDCRHVTRGLERALLTAGERLVRVPPRLTASQRRRSRTRGKSDGIDALAIARAALQEPWLGGPRAGEERLHELKLLVDHRDDLVDERRRCQQRLRWHLHELDPNLHVPLGALHRSLPHRRTTRPPRRRRAARCQLRQTPTTPTRPWRQPTTQLRPPPDRSDARPRPRTRPRLPRAQTSRRQKPTRSHPLPQTTTRPNRLHNTQNGADLDIGATLAQPIGWVETVSEEGRPPAATALPAPPSCAAGELSAWFFVVGLRVRVR